MKTKMFRLGLPIPPPLPNMADVPRRRFTSTKIHVMALDGLVNVNSLFTFAIFLGLAWYPTTDPSSNLIDKDAPCAAGVDIAENLIAYHVYSFSSFLFSSLIASAMKQAIKIIKDGDEGHGVAHAFASALALRVGMLVSAVGSALGCGFLMLALVDLVQIKLGTFACERWETLAATVPLVTLVPLALMVYIVLVLHAVTR